MMGRTTDDDDEHLDCCCSCCAVVSPRVVVVVLALASVDDDDDDDVVLGIPIASSDRINVTTAAGRRANNWCRTTCRFGPYRSSLEAALRSLCDHNAWNTRLHPSSTCKGKAVMDDW